MSKIITLVILQAIFCFTLSYSDSILIQNTCKKTLYPDLCASTLRSNPRSSKADVNGLAVIVADTINTKSVATFNQIGVLVKSTKDANLVKALSNCLKSYNAIKALIPATIEAMTKGNPKFAIGSATDAANEAQKCGQNAPNLPISAENNDVHDLCLILKSIASTST